MFRVLNAAIHKVSKHTTVQCPSVVIDGVHEVIPAEAIPVLSVWIMYMNKYIFTGYISE